MIIITNLRCKNHDNLKTSTQTPYQHNEYRKQDELAKWDEQADWALRPDWFEEMESYNNNVTIAEIPDWNSKSLHIIRNTTLPVLTPLLLEYLPRCHPIKRDGKAGDPEKLIDDTIKCFRELGKMYLN